MLGASIIIPIRHFWLHHGNVWLVWNIVLSTHVRSSSLIRLTYLPHCTFQLKTIDLPLLLIFKITFWITMMFSYFECFLACLLRWLKSYWTTWRFLDGCFIVRNWLRGKGWFEINVMSRGSYWRWVKGLHCRWEDWWWNKALLVDDVDWTRLILKVVWIAKSWIWILKLNILRLFLKRHVILMIILILLLILLSPVYIFCPF